MRCFSEENVFKIYDATHTIMPHIVLLLFENKTMFVITFMNEAMKSDNQWEAFAIISLATSIINMIFSWIFIIGKLSTMEKPKYIKYFIGVMCVVIVGYIFLLFLV